MIIIDVIVVDKFFSMLMGDEVEFCCDFIEVNVLYVELDI